MKKRRLLALTMAIVMTTASLPWNAFASEDGMLDVIEQDLIVEEIGSELIEGSESVAVEEQFALEEVSTEAAEFSLDEMIIQDEVSDEAVPDGFTEGTFLETAEEAADLEEGFSDVIEDIELSEETAGEEPNDPGAVQQFDDFLKETPVEEAAEAADIEAVALPEEFGLEMEADLEGESEAADLELFDIEEELLDQESAEMPFEADGEETAGASEVTALQLNTPVLAEIAQVGDRVRFSFTAEEDGNYVFYSTNIETGDPYGYLYDADGNQIDDNDDSNGNLNFRIVKEMQAGETCFLEAADYGDDDEAIYYVNVRKRDLIVPETYYEYTVEPGETLTLTAEATSSSSLSYQWYGPDSSEVLSTEKVYTLTADRIGYWYCDVADETGVSERITYHVQIDNAFEARAIGETSRTVAPDTEVTLQVEATAASGGFTYQWYKNGSYVEGAEEAALTITADKTGYYYCYVYDAYGNSREVYFNIQIDNAFDARAVGADEENPHSLSQTVAPDTEVTLQVEATAASGGFTYRWYKDGSYVEGAEEAALTITAGRNSYYYCYVYDEYGNSTNVYFNINIDNAFEARAVGADENDPNYLSQTVAPDTEVTLQVEAEAAKPGFTYEWYDDWTLIAGEESESLTVTANQYGYYICRVYDAYGNSREVYFNIYIDNAFEARAVGADENDPYYLSQTVAPDTEVTLQVEATAASGGITYQWYKEGSYLEGTEEASLTVIAERYCDYYCLVHDDYGNSRNVWFYINIDNEFNAYANRTEFYINPGDSIDLEAVASCRQGELTYEWYVYDESSDEWTGIGENSSVLHVDDIREEAEYYVRVSDKYGNNNTIWYYTYFVTELTLNYKEYYSVLPGESVQLLVTASSPDIETPITYSWDKWVDDDEDEGWQTIEGAETDTLDISPVGYNEYRCVVTQGEQTKTAYIDVSVSSGLNAYAEQGSFELALGEAAELKVYAESKLPEITYRWYKGKEADETLLDNTGNVLGVVLQEACETYLCVVSDGYGERTVQFTLIDPSGVAVAPSIEEALEIHTGETKLVSKAADGYVYLKFVPEEDGEYAFYSGNTNMDTYGTLLNAEGNEMVSDDDNGGNSQFRIETELTGGTTYYVRARGYNNEEAGMFTVTAELLRTTNGFYAYAKDDKTNWKVMAGETVTLEVVAGCTKGDLSYTWYMETYDPEEESYSYQQLDEDSSMLRLSGVTESGTYYAAVNDAYGNSTQIWFYVHVVTGLELDYTDYVNIQLGETATLSVTPVSPDTVTLITYQWRYYDREEEAYVSISGATSSEYMIQGQPYSNYQCIATQGEQTAEAYFRVYVDTGFEVESYRYTYTYPTGSSVKLEPVVTGSLPITYTWYKNSVSYLNRLNLSDSAITVKTASIIETYICVASDGFASGNIRFVIEDATAPVVTADTAADAETIRTGETKHVQTADGGSVYLKYVPEADGVYRIYSEGANDAYGYLQDSEQNTIYSDDDGGEEENFLIEATLTGGETYYIRVREYDDDSASIYVTVESVCGHVSDGGKITKAATCTTAGEKTYTCTICGQVIQKETIPATGAHSWSAWTVTKAATCVAAGSQTRTCSVCKKTETQAIAATGKHTPVAMAAVSATCTAVGKTDGTKCSVCGKVLTAQQTIPAKGHTPIAVAAVAATCTVAGKTAGTKCSVCGTVITAQQTVPATGHTWDVGKVTTEPTAAAAGVKTYTCTKCGATKTEAIPKLTAEEAQKKAEGDPADPKSVAGAEKAMTAVKDTGEPVGSSFSAIQLQSTKQTKNSITLKWNKVKGASGYIVYGSPCGSKYKLQRIAKQTKNSFVYKKLKKGTYYKFTVAAYKSVDGREEVIGSSKMIHVATSGGKVTNVKKITATVKKKAVKKLTLKAKKSATIAVKQTLQNKKLKLKKHRVIKYESSDPKIAKVTAKGKVTAKKKGKCFIYVYSQSGVFAKVTLTVK